MKKLFKLLLCALCVALVLTCFAACGKTYSVTFNAGENDGYVVTVKKGSKALPPAVECADGVLSKAGTTTSKERAKNSISTRKSRRT